MVTIQVDLVTELEERPSVRLYFFKSAAAIGAALLLQKVSRADKTLQQLLSNNIPKNI